MFPHLDPETLDIIRLALAYLFGGLTVVALAVFTVVRYDMIHDQAPRHRRYSMDVNGDLEHIEFALNDN